MRELCRVASRVVLAATSACAVPAALDAELRALGHRRTLGAAGAVWELH